MKDSNIHIFSEKFTKATLHAIGNIVIIDESQKLILDKKNVKNR